MPLYSPSEPLVPLNGPIYTYTGQPARAVTSLDLVPDAPHMRKFRRLLDTCAALAEKTKISFRRAALNLREVRLEGATITDTTENMAAITSSNGAVVALKSDLTWWVTSWSRPEAVAPVDPIDTGVRDAAKNADGRIVACGLDTGVSGGSLSYSDDDGGSWTAGAGGSGLQPHRILYSPVSDRFIVSLANTDEVWLSDDGTVTGGAFPSSGLANGEATNGLAIITETFPGPITVETIVICGSLTGAVGRPGFRKSQDGGSTWSGASQLGAGVYENIGCLCGNSGTTIYHVGVLTGGASLRVSSSVNATAWLTVATIAAPAGTTFSASNPRIMQCADTGLLVIAAALASGLTALYASTDGAEWVGPQLIGASFSLNAFALAGGKLFATRNDMLFASDGVLFTDAGQLA